MGIIFKPKLYCGALVKGNCSACMFPWNDLLYCIMNLEVNAVSRVLMPPYPAVPYRTSSGSCFTVRKAEPVYSGNPGAADVQQIW